MEIVVIAYGKCGTDDWDAGTGSVADCSDFLEAAGVKVPSCLSSDAATYLSSDADAMPCPRMVLPGGRSAAAFPGQSPMLLRISSYQY
eukprot:1377408-Rhodomonas_salina.2